MRGPQVPFFVLGHPRSGTTALARLLNGIEPVACLYYEGNLLYRLWQTLQRVAVLDEPVEDLVADFEVTARHNLVHRARQTGDRTILFPEDGVMTLARSFRDALQTLREPEAIYARVSREFFALFREISGKEIVGDKVPDFMFVPDRITAPHPASRVVVTTRDPRAVIHSSLRFGRNTLHLFAVDSAFALAIMYCLRQQVLQEFLSGFPPERVLWVSQESLRRYPEGVLEKTCRFFAVPWQGDTALPGRPVRGQPWQAAMSPDDREAVQAVCAIFGNDPRPMEGAASSWQEKAAALLPLVGCDEQDIPSLVQHAAPLFLTPEEKRALGLALVQFADHAQKRSRFFRAREFFAQAADFIPQEPVLWYKYAALCYDMKHLSEAQRCAEKFDACCPRTRYYRFLRAKKMHLLGMVQRICGSNSKARACFTAALAIKPDFLLPRKLLAVQATTSPRLVAGTGGNK